MGEAKLTALIQESLSVATRIEAMKAEGLGARGRRYDGAAEGGDVPDRCQAVKRARERLVRLAAHLGVELRQ